MLTTRHPHRRRAQDHRAPTWRRSRRSARASKRCCRRCRGTRSVFAERSTGGYFLDVDWNREELARYGLSIDEAQSVVQNAIGGENVTTTIEGRERYPVNVRYMRDFRSDIGELGAVPVPASADGGRCPLAQLARRSRPSTGPVHDPRRGRAAHRLRLRRPRRPGRAAATSRRPERVLRRTAAAAAGLRDRLERPVRGDERVRERLLVVVPLTLLLIVAAAVPQHPVGRSRRRSSLLAVPFSAIGAIWFLYLARLQHERRRLGRAHRAARRRRGNRRLHAALSGSGLRGGEARGAAAQPRRTARGGDATAPSGGSGRSS